MKLKNKLKYEIITQLALSNFFAGHIGLVDYDVVELGNLHRQILHTESRVEQQKSASVAQSCNQWVFLLLSAAVFEKQWNLEWYPCSFLHVMFTLWNILPYFRLNSKVTCTPYHLALNSSNALNLIEKYDIIVDATDNVATRYLLNDACILAEKPLVSGSALRFEGQVVISFFVVENLTYLYEIL